MDYDHGTWYPTPQNFTSQFDPLSKQALQHITTHTQMPITAH